MFNKITVSHYVILKSGIQIHAKNALGSHQNSFLALYFKERLFLKKLKYEISSKFVQWGPGCSMRTGRQTN
jgi:hypothetical protein